MCEPANKDGLMYKQNSNSCVFNCLRAGRDSVVGIATHYRLDGPGIKSRMEQDFLCLYRPALGPAEPPIARVPGHSWG
jgi:hypothetical protein